MPALDPRDRRALRTGALVVGVALAWTFVARPSMARRADLADLLDAERARLARELAVGRDAPTSAPRSPDNDSLERALDARLFTGADGVIATAQLVDYLGDAARRHEVWMQVASTRPATEGSAGLRTLEVELRAESDIEGLLRFLDAIEQGPRHVRVVSLDVRAPGAPAEDGTTPLSIVATVQGHARTARAADSGMGSGRVADPGSGTGSDTRSATTPDKARTGAPR